MAIIKIDNPMWDEVQGHLTLDDPYGSIWRDVWGKRKKYCSLYSWAIASNEALQFVAEQSGGKLVEMGAGTGYWASRLALLGIDVIAYDVAPPDRLKNHWHHDNNAFFLLQEGEPEVLANHADRTLFLCWPPYNEPMAYDCLSNYPGKRVIYIGEGSGGCTGNDAFHHELYTNWHEVEEHLLPQWDGIHDYITVYERGPEANND